MDFLDPKKQQRRNLILIVGYVFIAIAISLVLWFLFLIVDSGYGLGKDGQVVQSGLLFASSTPSGANITLNNIDSKAKTNARLLPLSGSYTMKLDRAGYRPWQRSFNLEGASVLRIDYPFLFPKTLATTNIKTYDKPPGLATQSPDRRWLLVLLPGSDSEFDMYDLKSLTAPPTRLTLPTTILAAGTTQNWSLGEWSDDNQHVLLNRTHDGKTEFVLLDRTDATKSLNLNQTLGINPTKITLLNKKYDQYYVYDAVAQTLQTSRLDVPAPVPYLSDVLAYQSYGSNIMLYASSKTATAGKVAISLLQDGKTHLLREVPANTTYMLNLTQYDGSWFIAAGASSENKVYVYKNPVTQLNSKLGVLVPIYVLKTQNPNYIAFSSNARFIMDENESNFSVYDAEYDKGFQYDTKNTLDAPQVHANWMDGHRLDYVSGGKLVVWDFDSTNKQVLNATSAGYPPFFNPDYKYLNVFAPARGNPAQQTLTRTALRIPTDL